MVSYIPTYIDAFLQVAIKDATPSGKSPATESTQSVVSKDQKRKRPGRPQLLKRYTFQEMSANTYAVNNLEYDLGGEVVLSPATKAMFAFQTEPEATVHGPTEFNIDLASVII